jgi:hypothetical protein
MELGFAAMLLGYRDPPPFMARWMREEIASGRLPRIELGWIDRLVFALLVGFLVAGPIATVVLVVVFHEAG